MGVGLEVILNLLGCVLDWHRVFAARLAFGHKVGMIAWALNRPSDYYTVDARGALETTFTIVQLTGRISCSTVAMDKGSN